MGAACKYLVSFAFGRNKTSHISIITDSLSSWKKLQNYCTLPLPSYLFWKIQGTQHHSIAAASSILGVWELPRVARSVMDEGRALESSTHTRARVHTHTHTHTHSYTLRQLRLHPEKWEAMIPGQEEGCWPTSHASEDKCLSPSDARMEEWSRQKTTNYHHGITMQSLGALMGLQKEHRHTHAYTHTHTHTHTHRVLWNTTLCCLMNFHTPLWSITENITSQLPSISSSSTTGRQGPSTEGMHGHHSLRCLPGPCSYPLGAH